jgi:hypothetical protein
MWTNVTIWDIPHNSICYLSMQNNYWDYLLERCQASINIVLQNKVIWTPRSMQYVRNMQYENK